MFELIKGYDGLAICREMFTDVLYIITTKSATVMVDKDGSPLLYSKWLQYKERYKNAGGDTYKIVEC